MGRQTLSSVFQVGLDILSTVRDTVTKTILANLGDVVTEQSESDEAEWWQHVGFASRPSKADKTAHVAAQCVTLRTGGRDAVIASRDLRGQTLAGNLQPGETCIYASGDSGTAQARILLKADGSINLYTREGNTESGGGMAIMLTPSSDTISIVNSAGFGLVISPDGVKLTAGDAGLTLDASGGIKLVGTATTQIDGTTIALGANPAMNPATNSVLTGLVGMTGKPSLKVLSE
jgi:hypothetical protein